MVLCYKLKQIFNWIWYLNVWKWCSTYPSRVCLICNSKSVLEPRAKYSQRRTSILFATLPSCQLRKRFHLFIHIYTNFGSLNSDEYARIKKRAYSKTRSDYVESEGKPPICLAINALWSVYNGSNRDTLRPQERLGVEPHTHHHSCGWWQYLVIIVFFLELRSYRFKLLLNLIRLHFKA